jgi:hypothetical protein
MGDPLGGDVVRARFLIENPDDLEATMKITMKLKEWIELRDQLQNAWPSSRLSGAITSVIAEARKTFYPVEDKDAFYS